jgi:DNA-binding CsgD family transcriptional regulator
VFLGQAVAEAALWQGRAEEAAARAAAARAALNALEPHPLGGIALAALELAALADGAPGDPAPVLAAAEDAFRLGLPRGTEPGPEAVAWLERARAEAGRLTGPDPAAWTRVVEAFGYEPGPGGGPGPGYRGAHALLRRAQARLALGEPGAAEDLAAARGTAARLRAAPLLAAVDALAARAGVALPGAARLPVPDLLTPRERSVLAEVALGRTNRQVGAALFISEKTVSVHLSRVMAKLGASSRTQAVSIAHARGLLPAP